MSSGATFGEVGNVLSHDSVQSSERYSHLYPERIKELLMRLPTVIEKSAPPPTSPLNLRPEILSKSLILTVLGAEIEPAGAIKPEGF